MNHLILFALLVTSADLHALGATLLSMAEPVVLLASTAGTAWISKLIAEHIKNRNLAQLLEQLETGTVHAVNAAYHQALQDIATNPDGSISDAALGAIKRQAAQMVAKGYAASMDKLASLGHDPREIVSHLVESGLQTVQRRDAAHPNATLNAVSGMLSQLLPLIMTAGKSPSPPVDEAPVLATAPASAADPNKPAA